MRILQTTLAALVISTLPVIASAQPDVPLGRAHLDPENPLVETKVRANIKFIDDGTTLAVLGTATGLVSGVQYTSLVYDIGALSTGPAACQPTIFGGPDSILTRMFVGNWINHGNGTGTLMAAKTGGNYVPLNLVGAMSVRGDDDPQGDNNATLRACGDVQEIGPGNANN